jgi:hypothetical protein
VYVACLALIAFSAVFCSRLLATPRVSDQLVGQDLNTLRDGIEKYGKDNQKVPANIQQIPTPTIGGVKEDLNQTRQHYFYKKLSPVAYELCTIQDSASCKPSISNNAKATRGATKAAGCAQEGHFGHAVTGQVQNVDLQLGSINTIGTTKDSDGKLIQTLSPWCDLPPYVYDSNGTELNLVSLKPGQSVAIQMVGVYAVSIDVTDKQSRTLPDLSQIEPETPDQTAAAGTLKNYCKGGLGPRANLTISNNAITVSAKCKAADSNDQFAYLKKTANGWDVAYLGIWPVPSSVSLDCIKYFCADDSSVLTIYAINKTGILLTTQTNNKISIQWSAASPPVVKNNLGDQLPLTILGPGQKIKIIYPQGTLKEIDTVPVTDY